MDPWFRIPLSPAADVATAIVHEGDRAIHLHRDDASVPALLQAGGILPVAAEHESDPANPAHLEVRGAGAAARRAAARRGEVGAAPHRDRPAQRRRPARGPPGAEPARCAAHRPDGVPDGPPTILRWSRRERSELLETTPSRADVRAASRWSRDGVGAQAVRRRRRTPSRSVMTGPLSFMASTASTCRRSRAATCGAL